MPIAAALAIGGFERRAEAQAPRPLADIVCMIDGSGSMGDDIAQIKAPVNDIASQLGASVDPLFAPLGFGANTSATTGLGGAGNGKAHIQSDFTDASGLSTALGTMNGDFHIEFSFGALAPGVTLNEAKVAVDGDGAGPLAPAVVGPVSAEAEIAAVLGIQLPDTGDGSLSAAARGSGSLSPLALAAGALAIGAVLLAGVRTLAVRRGRDS